ncbi:unnamed protein product [Trichogramma brassicae]|uniref:Uncharacterized protein n=1 Tax=Trichogramma brassicae TaxID=86971 RepID=A0A6H5I5V3_9HYME|nr:unnamed protein product [Trichogramma brassicae]
MSGVESSMNSSLIQLLYLRSLTNHKRSLRVLCVKTSRQPSGSRNLFLLKIAFFGSINYRLQLKNLKKFETFNDIETTRALRKEFLLDHGQKNQPYIILTGPEEHLPDGFYISLENRLYKIFVVCS